VKLGFLTAGMAVALTMVAGPAAADISGDCTAADNFGVIDGIRYTPDNDTPDNPIILPDRAGVVVPYQGKVTAKIENHSGRITMPIGPAPITLGRPWSHPNTGGDLDAAGSYPLDDLYDKVPVDIVGLYRVEGTHSGKGGSCSGFALVLFEGGLFSSPVGMAGAGLILVMVLILLVALFGHPLAGGLSGFFFGLGLALVFQQMGLSLLDNFAVFGLPLALMVFGWWLGSAHPFGSLDVADGEGADRAPLGPWARYRLWLGFGGNAGRLGALGDGMRFGGTPWLMLFGLAGALLFGGLRHLEYGVGDAFRLALTDPVVWTLAVVFGVIYPLLRARAVGRWQAAAA